MTLRRTLVSLQIALVAAGLIIFGVTSYQLYRQSQLQRIHRQLDGTEFPAMQRALCQEEGSSCAFNQPGGPSAEAPGPAGTSPSGPSQLTCGNATDRIFFNNLTAGSFAELRSASGKVLAKLYVSFSPPGDAKPTCPDPALPTRIPGNGHAFTVSAVAGPGPFLVEGQPFSSQGPPQGSQAQASQPGSQPATSASAAAATLVVGVPLNDLGDSLHRLLTADLVVGAILLVALAGGSLVLIRRSLRPLERMAATSRAISAGDLSRRVTATDERSEVGQLGSALNGMLTRIEGAFAERDATEQRLRQFLADASHELRTPLTSIRGYAELWRLNATPADAATTPANGSELDARTAMARIELHARRMGEMIEELLLLARLDEAQPMQPTRVDLAVVAAEACDDAMVLDPGRPISLDADDNVVVIGDRSHLRRAVANLMVNAVRHTPSGTPIDVDVHSGDGVAQVVVRDHGPGMPEAGLSHAFDRFWQADASRATGGSGLGLAIVAGVAAEHGGAATVANAPDGGAVLTLRLPLPQPWRRGDPVVERSEAAGTDPGPPVPSPQADAML